ncbi:kinase-like domain-containing protein [Chaetomium tenue]|uniref:Kinase-like domain-containing protein n=1 Tax=Chaetomium tenue TaxID=1854479 RepID=A0ACB7PIW4_9PEZI|nr:kinase-like domain-containing protein [Chaetomium globosum]
MKFTQAIGLLATLQSALVSGKPCGPHRPHWKTLAPIPLNPRQEHTTLALNTTHLAILGGIVPTPHTNPPLFTTTPLLQLYNTLTHTWHPSPLAPLPVPLNHPNAAVVAGRIYLLGGLDDDAADGVWRGTGRSWVWDPSGGDGGEGGGWEALPAMPGVARGSAAVGVDEERGWVVLAGGMTQLPLVEGMGVQESVDAVGPVNVRGDVFALDFGRLEEGWVTKRGVMPTPRGGVCAGAVDGKVYVFGGEGNPAEGSDAISWILLTLTLTPHNLTMTVKYLLRDRDKSATQHDGAESLAVNNKFIYRFLTLLALKTTNRFYGSNGLCSIISPHLIVKRGPFAHLTEAATLRFLAEKTSIPVPRVHCAFLHKNRAFIVMERLQGVTLAEAWDSLSDAQRGAIFAQLKSIFRELRSLPPPPGVGIQSCVGGSLRDCRIPQSLPRFGPFKTINEFHLWLREGLQLEEHLDPKQDGPWPPPVLTHGDLHPGNIMVSGDRVTGIIDWEFAGWYPHYWEYTSAWYGHHTRHGWEDLILKFLDPYPEELEMEKIRQRWWGDF